MFRKILVALDGSAGARRAFVATLDLAARLGSEVWAISIEERLPRYAATLDEILKEKETANHYLAGVQQEASQLATEHGLALHTQILVGHPAQKIVEFAREGHFDLLVLCHSGHSRIWGTFMGTTADKISGHAPCSVMVVR